ncbi:MAG: UvrD-helicase domain-containing protein [Anaerolineaceae bacterium]|nr:UvrD-helicase domain-containing protein [Anaerolineaceae bacterium]MDE0327789.1 UvrD-helicase domain-containing protein [Anaerolineaceae bacterium]
MDLDQLNEQQRAAVTAGPGPVIVYAGPGSGKTRVLTQRLAWLVREQGVYPGAIMAVTFTNRAAGEMRSRVEALLGGRLRGARVGTFHSICGRLLRAESEHLPWSSDYVIFDADDQRTAVRMALADMGMQHEWRQARDIVNKISRAKCELVTAQDYVAPDYAHLLTQEVYPRYQNILLEADAMDFGDLLMQTVFLLQENEELYRKYGNLIEHLLVDEFQDTNLAQYRLVRLFARPQQNVFVVGDEDQAIYSWRGADWRNVTSFRKDFPQAQEFRLEQNYRSTQTIVEAARAVIRHNPDRVDKALFTARERGAKIQLYSAFDSREEAEHVVQNARRLMGEGRLQLRDFAVMYRSHFQSRALEVAFVDAGIPYRLVRGVAFYSRREVQGMMACLRFSHNPNDQVSFLRIVNEFGPGIGDKTLGAFKLWREREHLGCGEALVRLVDGAEAPFPARMARSLQNLAGRCIAWWGVAATGNLPALFDRILPTTANEDWLWKVSDDEKQVRERGENLAELRGQLEQAMQEGQSLGDFLAERALYTDVDIRDPDLDAVSLMTLHATKGTEFPVVFIAGVVDGQLPHLRSLDSPDQLAEERRLFYVGITRAMDALYLSCTFRSANAVYDPSRFLDDIPADLLNVSASPSLRSTYEPVVDSSWAPAPVVAAPKAELQFRTGMRVLHNHFGQGMVIESKATRDDEEVTVVFSGHGMKRLSASIAGLRALD